jgi:hypothetical protein
VEELIPGDPLQRGDVARDSREVEAGLKREGRPDVREHPAEHQHPRGNVRAAQRGRSGGDAGEVLGMVEGVIEHDGPAEAGAEEDQLAVV